jgi:hypothetical protein
MSHVSEQLASVATVDDQWPDLVVRAKELCRTVADRDLDGLPLYILLQSEVADVMGPDNFSDGYTTPNLDLNLQSCIADAWLGRGPCMVINDVSLTEDNFPEDVEFLTFSTVPHELAHILDRPLPVDFHAVPDAGRIEFETMVIANALKHEFSRRASRARRLLGHTATSDQSAHSSSACCSTVFTASSCRSGG